MAALRLAMPPATRTFKCGDALMPKYFDKMRTKVAATNTQSTVVKHSAVDLDKVA